MLMANDTLPPNLSDGFHGNTTGQWFLQSGGQVASVCGRNDSVLGFGGQTC